jgi:O-antigen ligase
MLSAQSLSLKILRFKSWIPFLLAAALFSVPISSTARGVFIGFVLVFVVCTPSYHRDLLSILMRPWCQALLLFFFIILLACAWGPASAHDKVAILKKYSKLLFLPLLAVGFQDPLSRRMGLHAYLLAMLLTCILSIAKGFALLSYHSPDPGQVFHNHIVTGLMMAFAAYIAGWLLIQSSTKRARLFYATLVILFGYQILFINTGRTGYLVYGLLMILLIVQTCPQRKLLFALCLGGAVFMLSYHESATMQVFINQAIDNVRDIQHGNKNNSIGFRMQFHDFAKKLFVQHPWLGNGTGSYSYLFKQDNPIPAWHDVRPSQKNLFEPHSQYWLVAAELGLLGLVALLLLFYRFWVVALRSSSMRGITIALLILFMMGSLSDSLLFYSGTGYFFLLFMAMCLAADETDPFVRIGNPSLSRYIIQDRSSFNEIKTYV